MRRQAATQHNEPCLRRAFLERVRTSIGLSGGSEPTLEQTLGMLFDAVEEAEDLLMALVVDGVRGFRTP